MVCQVCHGLSPGWRSASAGRHAAADQCLLPELLADWSFGPGRITTSAGYGLRKALLGEFEVAGRDKMATHSGKAETLLQAPCGSCKRCTGRPGRDEVGEKDQSCCGGLLQPTDQGCRAGILSIELVVNVLLMSELSRQ